MGEHIAVSGIIGAGKSTLVRGLAGDLGLLPLEERFEENPYLRRFYEDPSTWAFRNYVFFLQRTAADYLQARASNTGGIQERTLEEHLEVFGREFHARGYLDDEDLEMIVDLTTTTAAALQPPDGLVHIEIDPAEALSRVVARNNSTEDGIKIDYLKDLGDRYEAYLSSWERPLIRLDGNQLDFRKADDRRTVIELVRKELGQGQ
jgi:deoxyadenosine/deoxycytidine kinase